MWHNAQQHIPLSIMIRLIGVFFVMVAILSCTPIESPQESGSMPITIELRGPIVSGENGQASSTAHGVLEIVPQQYEILLVNPFPIGPIKSAEQILAEKHPDVRYFEFGLHEGDNGYVLYHTRPFTMSLDMDEEATWIPTSASIRTRLSEDTLIEETIELADSMPVITQTATISVETVLYSEAITAIGDEMAQSESTPFIVLSDQEGKNTTLVLFAAWDKNIGTGDNQDVCTYCAETARDSRGNVICKLVRRTLCP